MNSVVQSVDQAALAPVYALVAAALLVFIADLVIGPGRPWSAPALLGLGALGPVAAIVAALLVGSSPRATFCTDAATLASGLRVGRSCSFAVDDVSLAVTVLGSALALVVLAISVPVLRAGTAPAGEYVFLLLCSLLGLVVLGSARDLLTLLVAVETLTLPVYILVGLVRRRGVGDPASAEASVTFFVTSVVATAFTLLGIALLYGVVGAVHLDRIAAALVVLKGEPDARMLPLTSAAVVLVLAGLLFKLAAVPFHAWAPGTYDGAPLPIAAWLATGSKLGGALAVLLTVGIALRPMAHVVGTVLLVVAVVTMTVGNLVALRQRRLVRLLAWSAVAQTGYLVVPLGLLALAGSLDQAERMVGAAAAFTALYLVASAGTFSAVVALRGARDGGTIDDLRGSARRAPWATAALVLGLAGLAGLPPGLAGLFAKIVVVRAALDGSAYWLAVVIGLNAVVGLAYYARVAAASFGPALPAAAPELPAAAPELPAAASELTVQAASQLSAPAVSASVPDVPAAAGFTVGAAAVVTAAAAVVLGVWPQWVLDAAAAVATAIR